MNALTGRNWTPPHGQNGRSWPARFPGYVTQRRPEVRIAVAGCGYWGARHVRVLSAMPGVCNIALVEQDLALRHRLKTAFPGAQAYATLEEALPHVDAVVIATPPESHADLALMALREGKHVLVEKPLATSVAAAERLVLQARCSGTTLMVAHTFQFNPPVRELRRRLVAGEFGQITYIHSARLNLGLYRPDANVAWDLAPHDISILNYLLDSTPKAVTAWRGSLGAGGGETLAYIRFEYESPIINGYLHLSSLDPRKTRIITVVGSEKMAVYDDMAEERLRIYACGMEDCEGPSLRCGGIVAPQIRPDEALAVQDRHFLDSIRDNTIPETNGEQALAIIAVLEAIDQSMRDRSRVKVTYPTAGAPFNGRRPQPVAAGAMR